MFERTKAKANRSRRSVERIVVSVGVVGLIGGVSSAGVASGAKPRLRCGGGKVMTKVVYVRHPGGAKRYATGCAMRPASATTSLRDALVALRAASLTFGPKSAVHALGSRAARRVRAANPVTDAALIARVMPTASLARVSLARAAGATQTSGSEPIDSPDGTRTIARYTLTNFDGSDVGREWDVTTETTSTRARQSARTTKRLKIKYLMNRCPDPSGVARGTIDFTLRETNVVGGVTLTETGTFDGTIAAHFNDQARIVSVDVNGRWSYTSAGQASRRSVSGTVDAAGSHQVERSGFFNTYIDFHFHPGTGTDDGIAPAGGSLASLIAVLPLEDIQGQVLDPLQTRVLGGACVQIVTNADKVHVTPGGTVAIVAHLTDTDGIATFPGPITAHNGSARVSPTTAQANTDATFTYSAPATAHGGDTDTVQLSHISRRGKARDGTVTVIVDKPLYPTRFSGSWTSVFTTPNGSQAWTQKVTGTATYVRDFASPHVEAGQLYVDYTPESASVDWVVSGSGDVGGGCTISFSGSGSAQATGDSPVASQLTLEDVRNNPFGPSPEAQPYYYSIAATGNGQDPPPYTIHHSPSNCGSDFQGGTAVTYLGIGWPNNYGPNAPPDQLQKTSDPYQLQGHYSGPDSTGIYQVDTTWSFTGS